MSELIRVDELLVRRELAMSRNAAQRLIEAGLVLANGALVDKPSRKLAPSVELRLVGQLPYVSRAGEKLAAALAHFGVAPDGLACLDVGASTGGFTDCLLQAGAATVTCVDVGHGQLHPKLRDDPRITNFEGMNARELDPKQLPQPDYPLVVVDVAFISLTKILPSLWPCLQAQGHLIALIKPQFEAGPELMKRCGGVIKSAKIRETVVQQLIESCQQSSGWHVIATMPSPIIGSDGNHESLMHLRKPERGQCGLA